MTRFYADGHSIGYKVEKKGKAVPLQAWTGPEGSKRLRLPDFKTVGHKGGEVVSPMHRPPLPPRKYSWYSFPLGADYAGLSAFPHIRPDCKMTDGHSIKFQELMVKVLCYKSVGRWFDPSWCQWTFH